MRPTREHATRNEQTYFVTSDTWARRPLFRNERWAKLFVDTLYSYRGKAYLLHEFVVMPDHFHVLITPTTSLEKAVQFIKGGFSHRAKVELKSNMEIWQKGFSDHRIRDSEDYTNHIDYIYENPIKKVLCVEAAKYDYSSAHSGFDLDPVPQRLKPLSFVAAVGAAEAAPFQNRHTASKKTRDAAPFESRNRVSDAADEADSVQNRPQGLKPSASVKHNGTPE
ncbi:MAG TPA: transposase, partial [Terriglobales bacterium]|nr:transposase [Terriglobales bacterium]